MSAEYSKAHIKIAIGKMLQTIGWHSINSTPLELITDILIQYIKNICTVSKDYAEQFGIVQPNVDHIALSFRDLGISLEELEEYVTYLDFNQPPAATPCFPIQKENHLNFLKPGSKEVITRPVHIHEHLPPMNHILDGGETETESCETKKEESEEKSIENGQVFKRPADISPSDFKRVRREDEGSRPTREISSVMMTTSGFISPAREGKLPEARSPMLVPPDPPQAPLPVTAAPHAPAPISQPSIPIPYEPPKKAPKLAPKKSEKKKEKVNKELFKAEGKVKKVSQSKNKTKNLSVSNSLEKQKNDPHKALFSEVSQLGKGSATKIAKSSTAARLEKLNTTITPIPPNQAAPFDYTVDKLLTEPDKKKVNIFKKISNVKNDKETKVVKKEEQRSRGSSPDLIIDEADDSNSKSLSLPTDVTIEPVVPAASHGSPEKLDVYFDDGSPPGTPSTPKTPEMISHSPPINKEQKKKKEPRKVKKPKKNHNVLDTVDVDVTLEKPKTPEYMRQHDQYMHMGNMPNPFPFLANFGGPGLIPPPMGNPLFPFSNFPNFSKFLGDNLTEGVPFPPPNVEEPPKPPNNAPNIEPEGEILSKTPDSTLKPEKKNKEHKKEKKDKIKKKNKKDKIKNKAEKKKLKEEKKDKEKLKKEKKEKRKEKVKEKEAKQAEEGVPKLFLKLQNSPRPETPEATRKLNIKPIVRKDEEPSSSTDREGSPGLAKISALVTGPPKPKVSPAAAFNDNYPSSSSDHLKVRKSLFKPIPKIRTKELRRETPAIPPAPPSKYIDEHGNEVWICPACAQCDDGTPMIGCDRCDAWYHWVCVGIQVPPEDNVDWYCKHCLPKTSDDLGDKKKKRKKKEKKAH